MSKIITFASCRGGVGRTILTGILGIFLSKTSRVLIVDASMGDLSRLFVPEGNFGGNLMEGISEGTFASSIYRINNSLSIIPHDIDTDFDTMQFDTDTGNTKNYQSLATLLFPLRSEYDYILIDAPTRFGVLMVSSIIASDACYQVADLYVDDNSQDRVAPFQDMFMEIQKKYPDAIMGGIILSTVGYRNDTINKRLPELCNRYSNLVFKNYINQLEHNKIKTIFENKTISDIRNYDKIANEMLCKID